MAASDQSTAEMITHVTRLAPSPTGALHLGNARTFLINWLLARQNGWRVILRIEDLDSPRIKRGADQQAIEDLQWLGLDWDEGPIHQSPRMALYQQAVRRLLETGAAYPCICSRREVERSASAPHAEDGAAVYPGTCRGRFDTMEAALAESRSGSGRAPAIRFQVPQGELVYQDGFAGLQRWDAAAQLGDFVISRVDPGSGAVEVPAYQLAVVVDDAAMAVTQVVRGGDLLDSAPRQILLYRALGLADRIPAYTHLPLVRGPDGRRLAKRHGDTRLAHYREMGVPAGRVLRLLGRWCGIEVAHAPGSAGELLEHFDLRRLSRQEVVFTPEDDRWLVK
jgi:glutamyl-tRNA synthetase